MDAIIMGRVSKKTTSTSWGPIQDSPQAILKHCFSPAGISIACYGIGSVPGQEQNGSAVQQCRFRRCETP